MQAVSWQALRRKRPIRLALSYSFCGRYRDKVGKLVAGSGVYICSDCIVLTVHKLAKAR